MSIIRKQKNILKPLDFITFFIFLCFFFISVSMIKRKQDIILVEITADKEIYNYDINQDKRISVKGISGITEIQILNREVFIENSPCENKTCIHQGKISKAGQWLCCAPNQVIVVIKGQQDSNFEEPDVISF